ncbi:MAG: DUF1491 family protein [Rhodospirillales bacterium]
MSVPRVVTSLWVAAQVRLCDINLVPVAVRRRGDADAGSVILKLDRLDGTAVVLAQTRDGDGAPAWLRATGPAPVPDADAEAYIERAIRRDPDVWVVEIEDRGGRYVPDAKVLG